MKNKNKFSREGLIQACTDLRKNVDRDKIEFEQINMDATVLTRFENEIEDVKQVDQDGVIRERSDKEEKRGTQRVARGDSTVSSFYRSFFGK